jgi:hypothetical protein
MANLETVRAALLFLFLMMAPAAALAQSDTAAPPAQAPELPLTSAQIDKIQRALRQPPGLKLDEQQLRFYLEIVAKQPTFAEYARGYDFLNGPTRGGNPMSHQEFLQLVTPKEMYSSAGITATDQVQWALTNFVAQSLIRRALEQLKQAKTQREIQEIRDRIDRELDALTGASRPPQTR